MRACVAVALSVGACVGVIGTQDGDIADLFFDQTQFEALEADFENVSR